MRWTQLWPLSAFVVGQALIVAALWAAEGWVPAAGWSGVWLITAAVMEWFWPES